MREVLKKVGLSPGHLGLAYESWAPVEMRGKVPEKRLARWLPELADLSIPEDYWYAFERWRSSFRNTGDLTADFRLEGRLLIGHGNFSATDIGLTIHHTWGVPVIPGSALKGLLAHYVDAVYGPKHPERPPWEQPEPELPRTCFQGGTWADNDRRILRGPGPTFRALFGAPETPQDATLREHGFPAGATSGFVTFHDALYVPRSAGNDRPYAVDVLTVHQKGYYDAAGEKVWPNDHEPPNPVGFLTVRPGVRLLLALSGPPCWTELASRLLTEALREWGVGGKTSAGYGRGSVDSWKAPERPLSQVLGEFLAWLRASTGGQEAERLDQRKTLAFIESRWLGRLVALDEHERRQAAAAIRKAIRSPKLEAQRASVLELLAATGGGRIDS